MLQLKAVKNVTTFSNCRASELFLFIWRAFHLVKTNIRLKCRVEKKPVPKFAVLS